MARLNMERAYLADGRYHGVAYSVSGMPAGQRAVIESRNISGTSWRIERWVESEGFSYMGEYPSAEHALAGLQEQIDSEESTL